MIVKKNIAYLYYIILFLALLSTWARDSFIAMPLRLAYMAVLFVPIVLYKASFYVPCLVLFLTTSLLSLAGYTFLPTEITFYVLISFVVCAISFYSNGISIKQYPYQVFLLLLFLSIIVNLFSSGKIEKISYAFILMLLLPYTVSWKERDTVVNLLPSAFIIATLATAIMTLLNRQLLIQFSYDHDRIISGSLNYTCCTLGIGFVFALKEYLNPKSKLGYKLFCIGAMLLTLITIIMEASRGALLAIAAAAIVIIFTQKIGRWKKIFIIIFVALFVYVLYDYQILDLLIYRVQMDDGSGTGRTEIWLEKLSKFSDSMSPLSFIFGLGFENTWNLGGHGHRVIGCHNDYVAFFIEYGIVGIVLFLVMILLPFVSHKYKQQRLTIAPFVTYIIVTCLTLEPFSMGYLPFFFLLLYNYLVVLPSNNPVVRGGQYA